MSIAGELFGYDSMGNDLFGYPKRTDDACVVCGVAAILHTQEMQAKCIRKLWGQHQPAAPTPQQKEKP